MSLRSSGKEKATHEDEGSEDRGEQREAEQKGRELFQVVSGYATPFQ